MPRSQRRHPERVCSGHREVFPRRPPVLLVPVPVADGVGGKIAVVSGGNRVADIEIHIAGNLTVGNVPVDGRVLGNLHAVLAPVVLGEVLGGVASAVERHLLDVSARIGVATGELEAVAGVARTLGLHHDVPGACRERGLLPPVERNPVAVFAVGGAGEPVVVEHPGAGFVVAERGHAVFADVEVGVSADGFELGAQQPRVVLGNRNRVEMALAVVEVDPLVGGQRIAHIVHARIAEERRGEPRRGDGFAHGGHGPAALGHDGCAGEGVGGVAVGLHLDIPCARGQQRWDYHLRDRVEGQLGGIVASIHWRLPLADADLRLALRCIDRQVPANHRLPVQLGGDLHAVVVALVVGQAAGSGVGVSIGVEDGIEVQVCRLEVGHDNPVVAVGQGGVGIADAERPGAPFRRGDGDDRAVRVVVVVSGIEAIVEPAREEGIRAQVDLRITGVDRFEADFDGEGIGGDGNAAEVDFADTVVVGEGEAAARR